MKRISFIILFLLLSQFLLARKDSLKHGPIKNFRGLYATAYYGMAGMPNYRYSKYSNFSDYDLAARNFKVKIPNIGIGYILSHSAFFIRTDLSYCFGSKELNETYYGNSTKIDGSAANFEINGMSIYYSSGSYNGKTYYKFEDKVKGTLNLHYTDLGMVLGGNFTPNFRLYSGWRVSHIFKQNYRAVQKRKADSYLITGYTSQSTIKDSFLESTQIEFKNNDLGSINGQVLESQLYMTFGFCYNFNIKKNLFLIEAQYDYNGVLFSRQEFSQDYFIFKLSYVFKYSTDFGE